MYNIFSVLFTFPTVYRCASATQVDECRPRFSFGIYWRVGTVATVYFGISTPDPSVLLNVDIGVLPDNVEEV